VSEVKAGKVEQVAAEFPAAIMAERTAVSVAPEAPEVFLSEEASPVSELFS
jgi:hypothetical protein